MTACSIAQPEHSAQHDVTPELIRKVWDIAKIELWRNKEMLGQKKLDADACVILEMGDDPDELAGVCTGNRAGILIRKVSFGAADSTHQLQSYALLIDRRKYAIEIVKSFPKLAGAIIARRGHKADFATDAKTFRGHYVAAETEQESVPALCRLAKRIPRPLQTGTKRIC
jgi:hypothetical protein